MTNLEFETQVQYWAYINFNNMWINKNLFIDEQYLKLRISDFVKKNNKYYYVSSDYSNILDYFNARQSGWSYLFSSISDWKKTYIYIQENGLTYSSKISNLIGWFSKSVNYNIWNWVSESGNFKWCNPILWINVFDTHENQNLII
jgi:hypothetical protein